MSPLLILEKITLQQLAELGEQIASSLNQKQGFRLGESTVISSYLHRTAYLHPGEIRILINRDAGMELAHRETPGQMIHVDIFHEPAVVKHQPLVQIMGEALQAYLGFRHEQTSIDADLAPSYAERIFLETGTGSGNLVELLAGAMDTGQNPTRPRRKNRVQLLFDRFAADDLALIPCLVDAVETELAAQSVEIRKVEKIVHIEKKTRQPAPAYLFGLEPDKYQLWDTATTLTTMLSSPEDVIEFLQAFMPGMFRRKQSLSNLRNKHGPMRDFVIGMTNAGLIKRGWLTDTLTREGRELLEFVMLHQRELESQMRKLLRQVPAPSTKYQAVRHTSLKSKQKHYTYVSKTTTPLKNAWLGRIAVPETIVQAAKNRYLQKRSTPLTRDDIKVHEQVMSKPVDVCLVIDGSASMAGPKMKAVWQLAEHLLLTTRDRIAVVIFQRRKARVVIPFTRNYTRLKLSLRSSMHPNGLTPLADGIMEALHLIKNRHVRNPLLVLITDGVPTFGKWTIDPRKDALRAASMVPLSRAKLICIGVASNQEFLEELARQAKGSVYIVENLEEKTTLIEIVRKERKYQTL